MQKSPTRVKQQHLNSFIRYFWNPRSRHLGRIGLEWKCHGNIRPIFPDRTSISQRERINKGKDSRTLSCIHNSSDTVPHTYRVCGGVTVVTASYPNWPLVNTAAGMKLGYLPVTVVVVSEECRLVDGALEDEPRPAGWAERRGAEGADGPERVRPVRERGLGPVPGCPLWGDVAARYKNVCGGSGVHVDCRLTTQPQGHVGAHAPAQGTFPTGHATVGLSQILLLLGSLAPVVASMNVAASEVHPRLTLFETGIRRGMLKLGIKSPHCSL